MARRRLPSLVSDKPVGDPVVVEPPRERVIVDDALEEYVGWCRGCHYRVRPDAEGIRRCPECGLDAAPVLEDARRIRAHPRAARWMAWSIVLLAAALVTQVYAVVVQTCLGMPFWLFIETSWPVSVEISASTIVILLGYSMMSWTTMVVQPLTTVLLVLIIAAMRAARLLDRRIIVWISGVMVVAVTTQAYFYWRTFRSDELDWMMISATGSVSPMPLVLDTVLYVVFGVSYLVTIVGSGVALHRRWPVPTPPSRIRVIVRLVAVSIVMNIIDSVVRILMIIESHAAATGTGSGTTLTKWAIVSRYYEYSGPLLSYVIQLLSTTAAFWLLASLLCRMGHSLATLVPAREETPRLAPSHSRHRANAARWITAVFILAALGTSLLMPMVPDPRLAWDQGTNIAESWFFAALAIPFMLPIFGGAVHRSWRFGFLLIGVSIVAAVFGGAWAIALWG